MKQLGHRPSLAVVVAQANGHFEPLACGHIGVAEQNPISVVPKRVAESQDTCLAAGFGQLRFIICLTTELIWQRNSINFIKTAP